MISQILSIVAFITIFVSAIASADSFTLNDSECLLTGPNNADLSIKTYDATKTKSVCDLDDKKTTVICKVYEANKSESSSSTKFDAIVLSNNKIVMSNGLGNIKYVVDLEKEIFNMGQTNMVLEIPIVLNKFCTGKVTQNKINKKISLNN